MKLSNKVYDAIKWTALVLIPAAATFLGVIDAACGLGLPMEAIGKISNGAVAFLGAVIGFSTAAYNKGGCHDD